MDYHLFKIDVCPALVEQYIPCQTLNNCFEDFFAFAFSKAALFSPSCFAVSFSLSSLLLHALSDLMVASSYLRQTLKAFLQALSCFAIASASVLKEHVFTSFEVALSFGSSQHVQASASFFFEQDFTESVKDLVAVAQASRRVTFG